MANPNEYTPQQYREAALKWAEKLDLMEYWSVIDWIATQESGWRGIQSEVWTLDGTIVSAFTPGAIQEDSWGPFQLYREGVGAGKSPNELLDPDTNAEMALRYIKEGEYGLDRGYGINTATQAWSVTHGVDMEWVLENPGMSPAPGHGGTPAAAAPTTDAAGELVPPKPEDFVNPLDYWTALSMYEDIKAGVPSIGPDEIDYINASINLLAAQMSGAEIDVQKADLELSKRLGALTEAGKTYRELAKYALPEGTEFIPGGGPKGLYEQMGMGTMPASLTRINPLATALATMGKTPEMRPTPTTSFEAALAGAQQLRGGMGTEAAAPTTPLEGALGAPATTAPTLDEVIAGVEPGPMSARQPSAFPPSDAPAGPGPPLGSLSPEAAARIAAIIMAFLGGVGRGVGQGIGGQQPLMGPLGEIRR